MIDSSGRRFLRADGTVLDLLPVGQLVGVAGVLLVALFTVVKPEASSGLGVPARIGFWTLHVGLGLGALYASSQWLARSQRLPGNIFAAVTLTGLAAIVIAAPGYVALDALFANHLTDADPDPPAGSLPARLLFEAFELAPYFLAAWWLINLPVLLPQPDSALRLDDEVAPFEEVPAPAVSNNTFLATLPGIVGTDVVAVASDLHYLNVWTVAGRTMVLGNLKDVVDELGDTGMQVHRSHWVAHAHVRRLVGTSGNGACVLSNELRVPVSRRRWKAVRDQYGRGVVDTEARASD